MIMLNIFHEQLSSPKNYFYPIKLQDFGHLHVFTIRVENSVDLDQLASEKPADQDLLCLKNRLHILA